MEDYLTTKKKELAVLKRTMIHGILGAVISLVTCLIFYFGIPRDGMIVYLCFVIMAVCSVVHASKYIAHRAVYEFAKDMQEQKRTNQK